VIDEAIALLRVAADDPDATAATWTDFGSAWALRADRTGDVTTLAHRDRAYRRGAQPGRRRTAAAVPAMCGTVSLAE
jgi:hypothetical protein